MVATPRGESPTLAEAPSDWTVEEGTLAIHVRQMGKEITGSFSEWTAAITFEEPDAPGKAGEVEVTISIPSLTLGSVTSQALGPDFFAAESHPTATFTADLVKLEDGYEAQGTLALKGAEAPVTLPFSLELDGDTARMEGRTTLDRRNYAIGEGMSDPDQLGYEVQAIIDLTATRAAD